MGLENEGVMGDGVGEVGSLWDEVVVEEGNVEKVVKKAGEGDEEVNKMKGEKGEEGERGMGFLGKWGEYMME